MWSLPHCLNRLDWRAWLLFQVLPLLLGKRSSKLGGDPLLRHPSAIESDRQPSLGGQDRAQLIFEHVR